MEAANDNEPVGKVCTKCGEWKLLGEYHKDKRGVMGRRSSCKTCFSVYMREYDRQRNRSPERMQFMRDRDQKPERRESLLRAERIRMQRPEVKERRAARHKERMKDDANYSAARSMRRMTHRCLDRIGTTKSGTTYGVLGYTPDHLKRRIECQFAPGMSWENRGHATWHIDHKKPVDAFIKQGITDPRIINMLCNLRPMWALDNQSKNAKWTPPSSANDNLKLKAAA